MEVVLDPERSYSRKSESLAGTPLARFTVSSWDKESENAEDMSILQKGTQGSFNSTGL